MKKKSAFKSYMVAVTVRPPVTIYTEVLARSGKDAEQKAKRLIGTKKVNNEDINEDFTFEVGCTGIDFWGEPLKFQSVGKASQYHSSHDCKVCQKAEGKR